RHPGIGRERLGEDGAALQVDTIAGKKRRRVDLRERPPGRLGRRARVAIAPARADVEVTPDRDRLALQAAERSEIGDHPTRLRLSRSARYPGSASCKKGQPN